MSSRPRLALALGLCLVASAAPAQNDARARIDALNRQIVELHDQGRYAEAERIASEAVALSEKALGPRHPEVATSLHNLAELYRTQGRYADAEPLFQRSLATREATLEPDHPDIAHSLNGLAMLHAARGRYADAEPLHRRSLAIRERALGADHIGVAQSLNNLAALYRVQGRFAEAEPLYRRSLGILERTFGPDHPLVASASSNLAVLYHSQSRFTEAEPLYTRSLTVREKTLRPDHPDVAISLNNLALLYKDQARFGDAEPLFKRSLVIWEAALGADHPDVATTLNNLALVYQNQGRVAEAEPLYRRSLAIRETRLGPDHPDVANGLTGLADLTTRQGRFASAEPLYLRALAIGERALGSSHPDVARTVNNLALLYGRQGRYADAAPLYRRSLAIWQDAFGPDHPDVATTLANLAVLYGNLGRPAEGVPLAARSLAIREKALGPDHPGVANSLTNLAILTAEAGDIGAGLVASRRAVAILARRVAAAPTERGVGGDAEQRSNRPHFLRNVALVQRADGPDAGAESFRVGQLASASSAGRALAGMTARFAAGSDALAGVVRARQDLAERWQRLDAALVKAASQPPETRDAATEARLRDELADTGRRLDVLDARIDKDFPRYAELSRPQPVELAAVQALLAPDEALLVYLTADDATWLWALRRDRVAFHALDVGAATLAAEVTALRQGLDPDFNPALAPFDAARAHALHDKILAPAAPLLTGARHVFVVPDGALESLPIGVLVTRKPDRDPETPADHRTVAWFARDHAVTVLPSVGSLRALRTVIPNARAASPFVGIGNPVLEGRPGAARGVNAAGLFRGATADVAEVRRLSPLPETADELRAIAQGLGATEQDLYLAERASEPIVRRAGLANYRVLAFATHGLTSGELTGLAEPALVLSPPHRATADDDGLLTASEIASLELNADWVVLSACNTAAADGTPDAGGLSGLAKTFFYAGARALMVSHWSVPSKATVALVTGAFAALRQDPTIGRAEALRRAQLAMLDDADLPPAFAHPLAWAAFVLAGEGGPGR